ncbi:ubiquitin-conjugating enzyme E2 W-like isoform X2 [Oscarella lobularis]|uniref:ubiquitin-conjugating enzyme E2 W-like isoform X2 n=1 Tax=Oscarella lobularis TaxID=121494 RepID=UPI003313AB70
MEKRLQKELRKFRGDPPEGMSLDDDSVTGDITRWIVRVEGAAGTLYADEKFRLQFKFEKGYPFSSPQVTFVPPHVPLHPHVYTNGHICLSILTEDWTPALSVEAVCLSVLSMLSSCKKKEKPPDNDLYVRTCSSNPKKTHWWYHDDKA